jgi:DMSO/TMAO reductase YedYZ heme-binding membrane subunit
MRFYLTTIKKIQTLLLIISIGILIVLPQLLVFAPDYVNTTLLYTLAHISLFLVMIIRPLADLLPKVRFIRPLVILRKGMGVFSASIIVSFIIAKLITDPVGYLASMATYQYWSLDGFALFAHAADIAAILLLVTSNNFSKRILGPWWKRIQKLSYVYFYGSSIYLLLAFGDTTMIFYLTIVTLFTGLAYIQKRQPSMKLTNSPINKATI